METENGTHFLFFEHYWLLRKSGELEQTNHIHIGQTYYDVEEEIHQLVVCIMVVKRK